jgi:hypothetical protein
MGWETAFAGLLAIKLSQVINSAARYISVPPWQEFVFVVQLFFYTFCDSNGCELTDREPANFIC